MDFKARNQPFIFMYVLNSNAAKIVSPLVFGLLISLDLMLIT